MPDEPLEIFISYAHADTALKNELSKHLSNLTRQGYIKPWHDGMIVPGREWEQQVLERLDSAHLILLLISADFIASDFCFSIEMEKAMKRHHANQAHVIPILLRPTDLTDAPFSTLQILPIGAKAVTDWPTLDQAFTNVVNGIREAIKDLTWNALTIQGAASISPPGSGQTALWNIPYHRNPFFTGQETILEQLHSRLNTLRAATLTQPQAINGLGGIGKTQIVLEYAYRHEHAYRAILWVQADTRDTLISGFSDLASLLHLHERDAQDQGLVVEAVKRWLAMHEQWLLILDNADDLVLLDEFLPAKHKGHILFTTRAQAQGTLANGIEVEPMEGAEGALLLLRRAKVLPPDKPLEEASTADRAAAREIVQEVGGLPLALDQAAAYIEETRCGLVGYIQRYRAERTLLLHRRGTWIKDHPEPVAATWSLSFTSVERTSPIAADLLRLCAFLHPNAIPEELLRDGASQFVHSLKPLANNASAFDEAIAALRLYSLVGRQPESTTLSMHRLVQAVLKDAMNDEQQGQLARYAVLSVNKLFPSIEFTHWSRCERYLLHAQVCASLIDEWGFTFPEAASLLNQVGSYLHDRGRYEEAEPLLKQALTIREQQLGTTHPDTVTTLNNLAGLYQDQGKYREAEPLLKQALVVREQMLGTTHPDTATTLNNLAGLYQIQGKYGEAEPLYLQALAIREQELGTTHPSTATTLNNLAGLYQVQGKYAEAEPLLKRALAIRVKRLGRDHPYTATTLNNLAYLYQDRGKYEEAEPLLKRALAIRMQQLGQDHPDTATSLNNLAGLYQVQGKHGEAEPLLKRALAIRMKRLGATHPDTATCLNNLAGLYRIQKKYEEAKQLLNQSLAIRLQQLGTNHPDTATSFNNLAELYQAQGKYREAEPLYLRALAIREQQLGRDHPYTATCLSDLAYLYWTQGKYEEAEPLYLRALAICEQQLGVTHPNTATCLNSLALLYRVQKKYQEAEPLYLRALAICEQQLGATHPDTATSLNNLAGLYRAQEKYQEAEPLLRRALAICEQLDKNHLDTATSLNNLAYLYQDQGKYGEAEPLLRRALAICEQLDKDHSTTATNSTTATMRNNYATLLQKMEAHG